MHLEVHPASRFEARACTPQHTYTPIYPTSSLEAKGVRNLEPLTKSRRFYHVNHAGEVAPAKGYACKGAGYIRSAIHLQLHR